MNCSGPFVLAVDCGTQSIRGLVFDKKGMIVAQEKVVYDPPYVSVEPNWAERDPALYYQEFVQVIRELTKHNRDIMTQVKGISITTQRDSCVLLDKDFQVLRPAILWLDKRKVKKAKPIHPVYDAATRAIGMKKTIIDFSKTTPAHWLMENEKELWQKTEKYVMLSAYLHYRITGKLVDSVSAQTGHMPFNFKKQKWEGPFGLKSQIFQIPKSMLYPIYPAGTVLGAVSESCSKDTGLLEGLPVIASGSDKACETLGSGCVDESTASLSLGSQATIETASNRYYEIQPFIPPFPSAIPGVFNPEISVYRGFWMVSWFRKEFAFEEKLEAERMDISVEELLDQKISDIEPGSRGLMLQPYWGYELTRPESKGAIIGFSEEHTKYHLYRAILEGIGYALKEGMLKIESKSGVKIQAISISGGGARSESVCQMMADIFGRPIYKVQTPETSGLGAAVCAFVGLGTYANFQEANYQMVHKDKVYLPDETRKNLYSKIYDSAYAKLYARLKPVYLAMEDIDFIDNPGNKE